MDKQKRGKILSEFIIAGKRPRNQIATLSGLTNTYIRNLEKGEIENVPKKRLIALGVALNLDLSEMEILLQAFDRAGLMPDDIPVFIETARNTKFSEAVVPVRDLSAYELIHLALESAPGRQVIVNDRPTGSLMVEGHRTHTDRTILSRHTIFKELNEAIGRARRENLIKLVSTYPVDHYICKSCLEDYLNKDQDHLERLYRYRHVLSLLEMVKTQRKFNLYITETCFELHFTMKLSGRDDTNDKLSFSSRAPHSRSRKKRGRLNGFITENPALCKCFEEELQQVSQTIMPLSNKEEQINYLHGMLDPIAAELGENLEQGDH
jgi:hypothetical protein